MIRFDYPEILLLALPLWFLWRRYARVPGVTGWLRLALLGLIVVALAMPRLNLGGRGMDIVVVIDRSRSMPDGAEREIRDLVIDLENHRRPGDRISIVTFGARPEIERELSASAVLGEYHQVVDVDGSDLNEAMLMALDRRTSRTRPARILVLSDGLYNGPSPLFAARRAREQGVPVDFRIFSRPIAGDFAIQSVDLPRESAPNEPFQLSVVVNADQDSTGTVIVRRNGVEIARRAAEFRLGANRLDFRDWIRDGGLHQYTAELVSGDGSGPIDDSVPQNNRGAGVVRIRAAPRLLLVTPDGQPGNLGRAIEAARVPFDTVAPTDLSMTLDSLDQYRAVVLENVSADSLGRVRMERLAQFVEDTGGGLLMTGGRQSFGNGGYYKSPLDELLPVAMHSLEETRRTRAAIAVVLDRSGSMMAPVAGGRTKMDLANVGTAECVRLLTTDDMVAVIAVDSTAHVVQTMTRVADPEAICRRVLGIQSMGGGIFVYEGLLAAGRQLLAANDYPTRHVILFSDAADSEEPGDYKNLLKKFTDSGITVSVIGLGTASDTDAELLREIARLGQGNIEFSDDPLDLPRLFTQDTMNMTRNLFLTRESEQAPDGFAGQILGEWRLLGEMPGSESFPPVDGYNLTWLRPKASLAVVSQDENNAPFAAFWYRGLGRVAAIPLEMDGAFSGALAKWDHYEEFVAAHARWLLGDAENNQLFVAIRQEGLDAVVSVELDPDRPDRLRGHAPSLVVLPPAEERSEPLRPDFSWTGPDTLEGRFRLATTVTWRTLVKTSDSEFVPGPVLSLPYSPEYLPRQGLPAGDETLNSVAKISQGSERVNLLELYSVRRASRELQSLVPWLAAIILAGLTLEIAGRRWSWWERMRARLGARAATRQPRALPSAESAPGSSRGRKPWAARRHAEQVEPPDAAEPAPAEPSPAPSKPDSADVFARAKRRAKDRLQ